VPEQLSRNELHARLLAAARAALREKHSAALDPEVFLCFEDERAATTYLDCTVHQRDGTAPCQCPQRPRIARADGKRYFSLHLDDNNYAEANPINTLPAAYSFSTWVNLERNATGQAFFGKPSSTGGTTRILAGHHSMATTLPPTTRPSTTTAHSLLTNVADPNPPPAPALAFPSTGTPK